MTSSPAGITTSTGIIFRREVTRFLRQRSRVIAAVGTTVLLWLLLGSGFAESLKPSMPGDLTVSFAAWLLPGMMTLVAVFSAVFSSLSTIEDRQTGWLQAVLVCPVPLFSVALGRTLGGGLVAFVQAGILLAAIPLVDLQTSAWGILLALLSLAFTTIAMAALGLVFAWRCTSAAAFHGIMNLIFMPMWLLSGSVFPITGAAPWLETVAWCNPLTWCTVAIRSSLAGNPDWGMIGIAAAVALVAVAAATAVVSRRS
ncbi:MAG: ABC transporter permease [Phycisphaerales bacterium]|nr:ABC transporter permease [Phycisphaerales bacterium]